MRSLLRRQFTPVFVIIGLLIAAVFALIFVAITFPSSSNACGTNAAVCLNPLPLRFLIGGILVAGFPLNVFNLLVVIRAALRPPPSSAMDERIQHFLVSTLGSFCFGIVGFYLLLPMIQQNGAFIAISFLLGMVIYSAKPLIFLWNVYRLRRKR